MAAEKNRRSTLQGVEDTFTLSPKSYKEEMATVEIGSSHKKTVGGCYRRKESISLLKRQSSTLSEPQINMKGIGACYLNKNLVKSPGRKYTIADSVNTTTPTGKKALKKQKSGSVPNLTRISSNISENTNQDRFVPRNNSAIDTLSSMVNLRDTTDREQLQILDPDKVIYQEKIAEACGVNIRDRILAFNTEAPKASKYDLISLWPSPNKHCSRTLAQRKIKPEPEKILDAPLLSDDYYLSLLDWSTRNILAIGLGDKVYLWNGNTGNVHRLMQCEGGAYISAIEWSDDGAYLSVGISEGYIEIWSLNESRKIRTMYSHYARIGAISWRENILSSGSKDGNIWNHDVRIERHKISSFMLHESDVCGLEWRDDGAMLASGGNDNQVAVWDIRSSVPLMSKNDHIAAVKAVSWCPWLRNTLATGGGSFDRKLNFWNVSTNTKIASVDSGSQITSILWSKAYKEIFTSHGYPKNHLSLWKYPSLKRIGDLPGHDSRVLHAALSPDAQVVATAASDENLKFWLVWEYLPEQKSLALNSNDSLKKAYRGNMLSSRNISIR